MTSVKAMFSFYAESETLALWPTLMQGKQQQQRECCIILDT